MPLIATATSAWLRSSAPRAIAKTQATETAPNASMMSPDTPRLSCLASFE
jgi:hypothetical protein